MIRYIEGCTGAIYALGWQEMVRLVTIEPNEELKLPVLAISNSDS